MIIEGSTPLVTGGNRGIGEAFVRAFLAAGAEKVYVGTRIVEAADHLVDEDPNRMVAVELDVTRAEQVEAAAAACSDVNILVNNAGVFANRRLIGSDSMAAAREEMEVNYFGTLSMCRAFAPILPRVFHLPVGIKHSRKNARQDDTGMFLHSLPLVGTD